MKIKVALCFLALSGCTINNPFGGFKLIPEEQKNFDQEDEATFVEQVVHKSYLPSFLEHSEENIILDHKDAHDFYKWAALKGYKRAYVVLAEQYLAMEPANESEALYWLERGVQEEDLLSMMRLARYYALEKSSPQYPEAEKLIQPLVEQEYLPAIKLAAQIAQLAGNQGMYLTYLNKARSLGDIDAEHQLESFVINDRENLEKDLTEQQDLYQEIEDLQGFWQHSQSLKKKHHDIVSASIEKQTLENSRAREELRELVELAQSQNSQYASLILARQTFETGFHHQVDRMRYKQLLESSLQIRSGKTLYARSIFKGMVDGSNEKAFQLLNEAAELQDPYALFVLSLHSRLVKKDFAESTKYYYKALSLDKSSNGQYQAAMDLYQEYLPFSNLKIASEWFIDLAYADYPLALLQVARLKEENQILCQSVREIFLHRAKAAYLGSPEASYLVGNMYLKGQGVQKDLKKSFLWVMHAARAGYVPAQYQLSLMYKKGIGVIEDSTKSYAWLTLVPKVFEQQELIEQEMLEGMSDDQLAKAIKVSDVLKQFYQYDLNALS